MVFKNICVHVLWMKVTSAIEVLKQVGPFFMLEDMKPIFIIVWIKFILSHCWQFYLILIQCRVVSDLMLSHRACQIINHVRVRRHKPYITMKWNTLRFQFNITTCTIHLTARVLAWSITLNGLCRIKYLVHVRVKIYYSTNLYSMNIIFYISDLTTIHLVIWMTFILFELIWLSASLGWYSGQYI